MARRRSPLFRLDPHRTYIAFFKPYGVLSQFTTDGSSKETLAAFGFPPDIYPVGRLDHDSEGLLLLSDDPVVNDALLNPKQEHSRTYLTQVENIPSDEALQRLRTGVQVQGRLTQPADALLLDHDPDLPPRPVPIRYRAAIPTAWLQLTLTEGRNRQVRRMTAAVGHPTLRLVRMAIGSLDLFKLGLEPGEWKELSHREVMRMFGR